MTYDDAIRMFERSGNVVRPENIKWNEPTESQLLAAIQYAAFHGHDDALEAGAAIRLHWLLHLVETTGPHHLGIYPGM